MTSNVYFMDLRSSYTHNLLQKLARLLSSAGLAERIQERNLVAVKLHFGEPGNTAFVRPVFIHQIIRQIKNLGAMPFLTDTNTLYRGARSDTPHHIESAVKNGFAYAVVEAPIVIADGLRGRSDTPVAVHLKQFEHVYIASDIAHADAMVSVAHFKGHELTGFAGTLKNIGMGCASRRGKLAQHCSVSPKIKKKRCTACGDCIAHCPAEAISMKGDSATIDAERCIGCGECILICPSKAVRIRWDQSIPVFMEKMVEYAKGALAGKSEKTLFLNFITDVSPACDCPPYNDAPIVRDIGILAATDPVAIDQAAVDLVNREPGIRSDQNLSAGQDKFKSLYPDVDWSFQLDYAQRSGLGSRTYTLIHIDD